MIFVKCIRACILIPDVFSSSVTSSLTVLIFTVACMSVCMGCIYCTYAAATAAAADVSIREETGI